MSGYLLLRRRPNTRAVLFAAALWFSCSLGLAQQDASENNQTQAQDDANSRGKQLYRAACTACHGTGAIEITRDGRAGWKKTVHKMVGAGAQLTVEEMELVIDYLAASFGPGAGPMKTGLLPPTSPLQADGTVTSGNMKLPDGRGKELVEGYCQMCHDLGRVVAAPRGEQEWRRYATQMTARGGLTLSEEQRRTMVSYLTEHFGVKQ